MTIKPNDLLEDIPRGVTSRYLREQRVPRAFFQDPERILAREDFSYDPKNPGAKILIGAIGDAMVGFADNRHIMTLAGSRAGKSVMVINNLYFYPGSVLCTDPKAELATKTAGIRHALGQDVFVLDPFNRAEGDAQKFRARYNPLARLDADNPFPVEDAMLIVDALVVRSGDEKEPHWNEAAGQFLLGLILYVAYAPSLTSTERHMVTMRQLINDALETTEDGEHYILPATIMAACDELEEAGLGEVADAIRGSISSFYAKSSTELAGVLSTVHRHTQFIDYGAMREVLSGHDFDLRDLKRGKNRQTVYLCLPAMRMGLCNRWLRIFVNQLLQAMEEEDTTPEEPVLMCLDEFPVLGFMSQLQDAAGQVASFGVKLWLILQDWGQGKSLYGERFESFAANAGILQAFGNVDLTTTEYLSKRLDKTAVETVRTGETATEQVQKGLRGENNAIELFDLMRPDEISRFFARDDALKRQLILIAGKSPAIMQRIEYFDEKGPFRSFFKQ